MAGIAAPERRTRARQGKRGAALALVVFALFILGMLSSTAFVLSFGERQVDRKFVRFQQASAAADAGAYEPLRRWDVVRYNRLEVGGRAFFAGEIADGTGSYEGAVTRLGPRLFLVSSEGMSANTEVRQRSGTIMRLRSLRVTIDAALEIRGPLDIGESVRIAGSDRSPYAWNCPPTSAYLPALRIPASDPEVPPWTGCEPSRCLDGSPLWGVDSSGAGSGPVGLGGETLADLRAVAAHILQGGGIRAQSVESNGICVTESPNNWGNPYDPGGACGDHFPAVYSESDLLVQSGYGQGIVVVDGDLTVSGDFHYFGVVVVTGRFQSVGIGSKITGAVIVDNRDFEPQTLDGLTRIQYSSCVVSRSLAGSGRGVLLQERSWLDLY
jgi:hypothetical protein